MTDWTLSVLLENELATAVFGEDLAAALKPGDVIALQGDLGAGKTTLARSIIRALADDANLEVPSPTFTLVQTYDARIPVAHYDLYRISDSSELAEIGLDEASDDGVVLVEWPERAGDLIGRDAIHIHLDHEGEGRRAEIRATGAAGGRIERSRALRSFLDHHGWGLAHRRFLQGDASTRTYETATLADEQRIVMNAPKMPDGKPIRDGLPYSRIAHLAEDVIPFVAIGKTLHAHGFSAPQIYAMDLGASFLLLEHLGSPEFLSDAGEPVAERYRCAAELLAAFHGVAWPRAIEVASGVVHSVPLYDRDALMIELDLLMEWYVPHATGSPVSDAERNEFNALWGGVLDLLDTAETSLVLRDYHSPNLIWRNAESGFDRLGLIDFQDAVIGPSAYDVASLAFDARVTISPDLQDAVKDAYIKARQTAGPFDRTRFELAFAIMAAQRNSKILGIFVRLDQRDGKPDYLRHLPRIRSYLARALSHPVLAPLREFYSHHGLMEENNQ